MSEFLPIYIQKHKWFRIRPITTGFGKRQPYVIGWDSEAFRGHPFLFQFGHPDGHVDLVRVTAKTALDEFVSYIEPIAHQRAYLQQVVIVGWNLRYEYTQLFSSINPLAWED